MKRLRKKLFNVFWGIAMLSMLGIVVSFIMCIVFLFCNYNYVNYSISVMIFSFIIFGISFTLFKVLGKSFDKDKKVKKLDKASHECEDKTIREFIDIDISLDELNSFSISED